MPYIVQERLKKIALFQKFSEEELLLIASLMKVRQVRKGAHIFFQDEAMKHIFFISHGKVKVYQTDFSGKEQIIHVLAIGEMFPHRGLFEVAKYPANAAAYEDAVLVYIEIDDFQQLLLSYPSIALTLLKIQGEFIADLHARLNEKMMYDTRVQVIKLLLRLSRTHGMEREHKQYEMKTNFTNQELANMIGTSRETMSRTLTNLRKQALIYEAASGLMMLDVPKMYTEIIY